MPLLKSDTATPFCRKCFQPIPENSYRSLAFGAPLICPNCYSELDPKFHRFRVKGARAMAIYFYNEAVRSAIYQCKGCGDIELAPVFLDYVLPVLRAFSRGCTIVPVPSSPSHDAERGFNHVVKMFESLRLPILPAILKPVESKQSDLSAKERQEVAKKLAWNGRISVAGKRILLCDDILTTGAT
ncbi:MAG: ComF family protein, partial [Bacilli bacterium]|nr:ComF family protein [Bacilli bacterium]